jgi:tol-pal system protein YbgF
MKQPISFCLLIAFWAAGSLAQAGTKEELLRLQSDVLALQNQIREIEKSFNEKTEGLKSLVVQLNDQVAKSNLILGNISNAVESQASGVRSSDQTMIQEIRQLSTKLDDAMTSISAMARQISELKVQAKPINQESGSSGGLSADSVYNQAFQDLVQGNFDLAIKGFIAYLSIYPAGDKAVAAQYNIGEAYYSLNKPQQAIEAFTRVITSDASSDKIASALFKRGKAELAVQDSESAIADFRTIIEKFPTAPESDLAKTALKDLGVSLAKPKETRKKIR